MDAENASLGDERRARREEHGHGRQNSESRGFAGFGSHGSDTANGSHGATNRSESVPDRGYTWTPAPLSTPNPNQHHTGDSAALDPFAAWSTPGVIEDVPPQPAPGGNHADSAYPLPPADGPPYDPDGPATDTLPTRSRQAEPSHAPGRADSAALPQISRPGLSAPALSPSAPIPTSDTAYPMPSEETTVPADGTPSLSPAPLSGAATTQLPTAGTGETSASGIPPAPPGDPAAHRSLDNEAEAFHGSVSDTGSLPSWLSSIGEEAVPHVESGGRRRKPDLTEPTEPDEQFNPFDDQHPPEPPEPATGAGARYELPAEPDAAAESDRPAPALPTRAPRTPTAAAQDEPEAAPAPLPARRLPRSAAHRAAVTDDVANGSPSAVAAHEALTGETATPGPASRATAPAEPDTAVSGIAPELPPRRLPRSASRYSPDTGGEAPGSETPQPDSATVPTAEPAGSDDLAAQTGEPAAPTRLAPPADDAPILDRLLDPEPALHTDANEEAAAPVAQILSRILESDQESGSGSRLTQPIEPATDPADDQDSEPADSSRSTGSPLTLVPDEEPGPTAQEPTAAEEARPPLETRRSRRAREAAEAEATPASDDHPEPVAAQAAPAVAGSGRGADAGSRHSRSEEGADIDIHLIMRLLTASDDLEVLASQADAGEVSTAEVARAAREARSAVLSAVTAWHGGPAQMVKFANALLQAAHES